MNEAWKQASQNEALDDHNGSWSDVHHDLQMKQTQSRITTREESAWNGELLGTVLLQCRKNDTVVDGSHRGIHKYGRPPKL